MPILIRKRGSSSLVILIPGFLCNEQYTMGFLCNAQYTDNYRVLMLLVKRQELLMSSTSASESAAYACIASENQA